ncbi:hypothetical protein INT48_003702, partial [Thamnidium elegans]
LLLRPLGSWDLSHTLAQSKTLTSLKRLSIQDTKCHFGKRSLSFLGFEVSSAGISPSVTKVQASLLTSAPVLQMPNMSLPFVIETDSSDYGVGAVLLQPAGNRKITNLKRPYGNYSTWHPVAYESKKLSKEEQKFPAQERELIGIVHALRVWRCFIEGCPAGYTVYSDHNPLVYFRQKLNPTSRLVRWISELELYSPDIKYKPGIENKVADTLSRVPTFKLDENVDDSILSMEPDYLYVSLDHLSEGLRNDWPLLYLSRGEDKVQDKELKQLLLAEKEKFSVQNNVVYRSVELKGQDKTLVKKDVQFIPFADRADLVSRYHVEFGHTGVKKLYILFKERYWWPYMRSDLEKWIKACPWCQLDSDANIPFITKESYQDPRTIADITARELSNLGQHRASAEAKLKAMGEKDKARWDSLIKPVSYEVGDMVMVTNEGKFSLEPKYTGPFMVTEVFSDYGTCRLETIEGRSLNTLIHKDRLKPGSSWYIPSDSRREVKAVTSTRSGRGGSGTHVVARPVPQQDDLVGYLDVSATQSMNPAENVEDLNQSEAEEHDFIEKNDDIMLFSDDTSEGSVYELAPMNISSDEDNVPQSVSNSYDSDRMDVIEDENDNVEYVAKEKSVAVDRSVATEEVIVTKKFVDKEKSVGKDDSVVEDLKDKLVVKRKISAKKSAPVGIEIPSKGSHMQFTFRPPYNKNMVPLPSKNIKPRIFKKPVTKTDTLKVKAPEGDSYNVQRRTSFWRGGDVRPELNPGVKRDVTEFKETSPGRNKKIKK